MKRGCCEKRIFLRCQKTPNREKRKCGHELDSGMIESVEESSIKKASSSKMELTKTSMSMLTNL